MPKKCANPKENPNKTCISGLLLCQQWLMKASWKSESYSTQGN